jgi:hypothetical protein
MMRKDLLLFDESIGARELKKKRTFIAEEKRENFLS